MNSTGVHRLIDRITWKHLGFALFGIVAATSCAYFGLTEKGGSDGLVPSDKANIIGWRDCIYFSIVTITSLGYGDIQPMGYSRAIASMEVLCGLVLVGFAVGKLTSETGAKIRALNNLVGGVWVDRIKRSNGSCTYGLIFIRIASDGLSLSFEGENFDENGELCGNFQGRMIDADLPRVRFLYDNSTGRTEYESGIVDVRFAPAAHGQAASSHYSGTVKDLYASNGPEFVEAWRVVDKDVLHAIEDPKSRLEMNKTINRLLTDCFPDTLAATLHD